MREDRSRHGPVFWLTDLSGDAATAAGPKAAGLARMAAAGLRVPRAFCIGAAAFRDHLEAGGLAPAIRGLEAEAEAGPGRRSAALGEIRRLVAGAPLAEALRSLVAGFWRDLGGAPAGRQPGAVRSRGRRRR